jgi:hypothetical protein
MLYFGRVGSSWGHRAFFGSSWGENVITPFFYLMKKTIKTCSKGKETKLNLACVARSNLSSRRNDQNYQYRKAADLRAFSVIPK